MQRCLTPASKGQGETAKSQRAAALAQQIPSNQGGFCQAVLALGCVCRCPLLGLLQRQCRSLGPEHLLVCTRDCALHAFAVIIAQRPVWRVASELARRCFWRRCLAAALASHPALCVERAPPPPRCRPRRAAALVGVLLAQRVTARLAIAAPSDRGTHDAARV